MPQTTRAERLAHLKAYLLKDVPAAKQFCKDRSLSDYLNQEQGTASFPEELRKLLRNKFFDHEVVVLQSCIAAGAVVRTPGVDWQRADWSNLVEPTCPKQISCSWGIPWLGSIWRV